MKCEKCTFDAIKQPELCETFVVMYSGTALLPVMEFDDSVIKTVQKNRASAKRKGFRGKETTPRSRRRRRG